MLDRIVDESYAPVVRREIVPLTAARLAANGCYRFTPPFLATIARGLDVSLSELGAALAVTEFVGLASPLIARRIEILPLKTSMVAGLIGVIGGTLIAAASVNLAMFAVGLVALAASKICYDVSFGSWIADHVPYQRRSRIVGLTETSWALGLLLGVTAMGVVASITNWRWGFVAGAAGVTAALGGVAARVGGGRHEAVDHGTTGTGVVADHGGDPDPADPYATGPDVPDCAASARGAAGDATDPRSPHSGRRSRMVVTPSTSGLDAAGRWMLVAAFGLMGASQTMFVTFGAWLEDDFEFSTGALAVVTFGLGALELGASSLSALRTDRWGKERSVMFGAGLMIPAGLGLAVLDGSLLPGLVLLGVFFAGFEFGVVSALAVAGTLVPQSPARGLGAMIAAGTLARGALAVPATSLFERHGLSASVLIGVGCATVTVLAVGRRLQLVHRRSAARPAGMAA